ncbi:hypothetical protein [Sphingomonas morindae]|uniref:Argininosuccinate lyase n=1 Tax=Sphingomonas morindae TaxID=1541170 RepID=A0ABY4XBZ5_9SPHN|nr:hypothetical protein [Sphingomonas morindae]USI74344.1 hypothetical protein LHA26_07825 [Sphingomonas morindae]
MSRRVALAALLALAVAGCGKKDVLRPVAGQPLPVKPATAPSQPSAAALLTPNAQSRPLRFNELVSKSKRLDADRFDLPPPR